jgi:hypothetical protein
LALSPSGICRGTVVDWCFDGTATAVDCAASSLACVPDAATASASCGDP